MTTPALAAAPGPAGLSTAGSPAAVDDGVFAGLLAGLTGPAPAPPLGSGPGHAALPEGVLPEGRQLDLTAAPLPVPAPPVDLPTPPLLADQALPGTAPLALAPAEDEQLGTTTGSVPDPVQPDAVLPDPSALPAAALGLLAPLPLPAVPPAHVPPAHVPPAHVPPAAGRAQAVAADVAPVVAATVAPAAPPAATAAAPVGAAVAEPALDAAAPTVPSIPAGAAVPQDTAALAPAGDQAALPETALAEPALPETAPAPPEVVVPPPGVAPGSAAAVAAEAAPALVEVAATTGPEQVRPAVAELARGLRDVGGGRASLVVRLDPPELGPVLVRLTVVDGRVDVQLRTSEAVAAVGLGQAGADVRSTLLEHGLDLSSFDVQAGGSFDGGLPQDRPSSDQATPRRGDGADRSAGASGAGASTGTPTSERSADGDADGTWL